MLSPSVVEKAQSLLKEGSLSKRKIAKDLGISRASLDKIEKKLFFPEKALPPQIKIVHFSEEIDQYRHKDLIPTYSRCPGCGGRQQDGVPCLVCQTRKRSIEAYDCYMNELLTPTKSSPLSRK